MSSKFNTNGSAEVPNGPKDSISKLAWSHKTPHLLAAASWDGTARVWEVTEPKDKVVGMAKAVFTHEAPVLSCCFNRDNYLLAGGCDCKVRLHDLTTRGSLDIGKHDEPISKVAWVDEKELVVSSDWGTGIKFWDGRQSTPVLSITCPQKIFGMDVRYPIVAVAAEKEIHFYDLSSATPGQPISSVKTPLHLQLKAIALYPNRAHLVATSVEGRCAVLNIQGAIIDTGYMCPVGDSTFSFKCHRIDTGDSLQKVFAVNSVSLHPTDGSFVTAGGDGTVSVWDKENKRRLLALESCHCPVNDAVFSSDGAYLAYGVSYDWHKGVRHADPEASPKSVFIHKTSCCGGKAGGGKAAKSKAKRKPRRKAPPKKKGNDGSDGDEED